jgi:membrane protein DedA with SNARE-associated domain
LGLTETLIDKLGYIGIAFALIVGGLGVPIPEEAPIILAAVLSKSGRMEWPLALASCLGGVLVGDFVVYFLGYFHGDKVLSLPLTRRFLTRAREAQIQGYFHRHGFKILILGRFAVGFRTAAYLTAGMLKLPAMKLFLTDLFAASLSTGLMFGLGYVFAHQIESSFDQVKHWIMAFIWAVLIVWLSYRFYKGRQRAGLAIGPPVLINNDAPLPIDDLRAQAAKLSAPPNLPITLEPSAVGPPLPAPTLADAAEPHARDDSQVAGTELPLPANTSPDLERSLETPADPQLGSKGPPTGGAGVPPSVLRVDSGAPPPVESRRH